MNELKTIHFKNRSEFRDWLVKNHEKNSGFWMVYHKKHTNKENITYDDALEEALCFGWIDSLLKRIDDDTYVRKFTPRVNRRNWSEKNRLTAMRLIREGIMTEAGLGKLWEEAESRARIKAGEHFAEEGPKQKREKASTATRETTLPDFMLEAFRQNEPALTHFTGLAPSHQKIYIRWITAAKREETIMRRLNEAIRLLQRNMKLGLK